MTAPKLSVLVPTFNYARYLPEAIESVLEQDWTDYELLIADDASQDGSAEVAAKYAARDVRIRLQVHPRNLGMVQNWNWCLSRARGEYVKFLFGDDKLANRHALSKLAGLLEANPTAVLAASARYVVDEHSKVVELWDDFGDSRLHKGLEAAARCAERDGNLIGEPSVVLFRRSDASRGFNEAYRQYVDLEMWLALLAKGDFVYTREPLCCFRRHARQQSEINKIHQVSLNEGPRMFWDFLKNVDARRHHFRKGLFQLAYNLRKQGARDTPAVQIERDCLARLGRIWYALYWLRYKTINPFSKMRRSWRRSLFTVHPPRDEVCAFLPRAGAG